MRVKILFSALLISGALVGAPTLYAGGSQHCADCLLPGEKDPVGNPVTVAQCWWYDDGNGEWGACSTNATGKGCDRSAATYCNGVSGDDPPGGGGGGVAGGGSCSTGATGACPPECMSCSGGGIKV